VSRRRELALLVLAALVVLFAGLGRADLFNPDEPREAEMAREMLVSGDHLVPHLNGEPYLEKPPLFYWGVVAAFRLSGGPGEAAARFLPALAGLFTVLLTFRMARDLLGERAALPAAVILMTAFQFFWIGRRCLIDMPLTLAVLLVCFGLHRVVSAQDGERTGWPLLTGASGLAAALLLKGIVGAAIPGLAVVGWLLLRRDPRPLFRRGLVPAVMVAMAPVALWVFRLHGVLGKDAVHEFVVVNNVMRFTGGAAKGHDQPFWYYVPTLLGDFVPWAAVLPVALVEAVRRSFVAGRERDALRDLLAWFLLPLALLSIADTKRGLYLLPVYPAAAMLVAWWMCRGPVKRGWLWLLWLVAALGAAAVVVIALLADRRAPLAPLAAALVLAAGLGFASFAVRRGDGRAATLSIAAVSGMSLVAAMVMTTPRIVNDGTSPRAAGEALRDLTARGAVLSLYDFKEGALGGITFYSDRTFVNEKSAEALKRRLEKGEQVVMRGDDVEPARRALPFAIEEAARFRIRGRPGDGDANDYVVMRSTAVAGAAAAPP
jgi:4-amino-4-deoxy-L-arabinose transferase-like glycosyltransferase